MRNQLKNVLATDTTLRTGGNLMQLLAGMKPFWILLVTLFVQAVLFSSAWRSFYKTWSTQDFSHGVAIIPIAAFLAWRMRHRLSQYTIEPSYTWLAGLLFGGAIWLAGHVTATASVMQLGAILSLIFTLLSFIGARLGRVAWFPICFLLLILPFGGWLTPYLTELTADAVHFGLQLLGIPVYREGEDFVLPTGRWSVVSACSGLRFVLSAVVLGFLYAHLNFRKLRVSGIFLICILLASVLANWFRALLTVLIGHVTNMRWGPGEEHLWLGWVVFGFAMWGVFWFASRWRDVDDEDNRELQVANSAKTIRANNLVLFVIASALLISTVFSITARLLVRPASVQKISQFNSIKVDKFAELSKLYYEPEFSGWAGLNKGTNESKTSQFLLAYFEGQANTASMLSLVNQVTPDDEKHDWKMINLQSRSVGSPSFQIREFTAVSQSGSYRVQYWYTVDGVNTISPVKAKILTLRSVILGRGDGAVLNVVVHRKGLNADSSDGSEATLLNNLALHSSTFTAGLR
jgi:exosortase A